MHQRHLLASLPRMRRSRFVVISFAGHARRSHLPARFSAETRGLEHEAYKAQLQEAPFFVVACTLFGLARRTFEMLKSVIVSASLCALSVFGVPSWSVSPFNPPAIPLAVKHPYLSTWLPQGSGTALNGAWPQFWTVDHVTAWTGIVRVDGTPYSWMVGLLSFGLSTALMHPQGTPSTSGLTAATQTSFRFTSSRSIFTFTAGPVNLTVTFLSVINPDDLLRHSIPFSYLYLDVASTDGAAHNVQVYNDISGGQPFCSCGNFHFTHAGDIQSGRRLILTQTLTGTPRT